MSPASRPYACDNQKGFRALHVLLIKTSACAVSWCVGQRVERYLKLLGVQMVVWLISCRFPAQSKQLFQKHLPPEKPSTLVN